MMMMMMMRERRRRGNRYLCSQKVVPTICLTQHKDKTPINNEEKKNLKQKLML
jgi:hypothetical protein